MCFAKSAQERTVCLMTIKELYEYAKENGMEDKHLVGVCLENGCVLVSDESAFGIEEGEIVDD